MSSGITIDTSEFDKAMVEYAAASGKDFADISNKRVYDVALRSIKFVKNANRTAINTLTKEKDLVWWFAWKVFIPKGMTRSDARDAAIELLKRRGKAVGFLKGFFRKMATTIAPFVRFEGGRSGITDRGGKGVFAGFTPFVKPATKESPIADVGVSFVYKHRSQETASKTESILKNALRQGIWDTTRDMMIYVDRKMGITAKKYSARAA